MSNSDHRSRHHHHHHRNRNRNRHCHRHRPQLRNLVAAVDMTTKNMILINPETDQMILVNMAEEPRWPGGIPMHTAIEPDGRHIWVSSVATETDPASLIRFRVRINWKENKAALRIETVLEGEHAGTPSTYKVPTQVDPAQPIATWTQPKYTQHHGPTYLPFSNYLYFTGWTDPKIRVIDNHRSVFAQGVDPVVVAEKTDHSHGIFFNSFGTLGLTSGYYYDILEIDVFRPDRETGELDYLNSIRLADSSDPNKVAAFTHYAIWLDNRYALTASMQFGKTSNTPPGVSIIGPSVWLLDVWNFSAEKILDSASDASGNGVFRSASDFLVAGGKLFIAEEDSLGETFGGDGYVSVFDFTDRRKPELIKRLAPGTDLPADFFVAHGLSQTVDGRFVYVMSYPSGYICKIDVESLNVVKTYGKSDGLDKPHGGFVAGSIR